jgi:hypothetical protein
MRQGPSPVSSLGVEGLQLEDESTAGPAIDVGPVDPLVPHVGHLAQEADIALRNGLKQQPLVFLLVVMVE